MRKKSRPKSLIEYSIELFGWGLLAVHLYRTLAFKTIAGLSLAQSNWVFWGIWVVCILIALLLTPKRGRTSVSVFASIDTPLAIYLMLSYYKLYKTAFTISLIIIGVALLFYVGLVLATSIPDILRGKAHIKPGRFITALFHRGRMIISVGLAMVFVVF